MLLVPGHIANKTSPTQIKTPKIVDSFISKQQGTTRTNIIYDNKKESTYKLVRGLPVSHFM